MKKVLVILFASMVCLSSCSTYKYTSRQVAVENHDIVASPTVVDVAVDYTKRVTETSRRCKSAAEAMQEAKYKAIINNEIDIIVDMIRKYDIDTVMDLSDEPILDYSKRNSFLVMEF